MKWTEQGRLVGTNHLNFQQSTKLCVICGDKANGYRYGVLACETCCTFWAKCGVRKPWPCKWNGTCKVDKTTRKKCRFCRFQKCKKVGMMPCYPGIRKQKLISVTEIIGAGTGRAPVSQFGTTSHPNTQQQLYNWLLGAERAAFVSDVVKHFGLALKVFFEPLVWIQEQCMFKSLPNNAKEVILGSAWHELVILEMALLETSQLDFVVPITTTYTRDYAFKEHVFSLVSLVKALKLTVKEMESLKLLITFSPDRIVGELGKELITTVENVQKIVYSDLIENIKHNLSDLSQLSSRISEVLLLLPRLRLISLAYEQRNFLYQLLNHSSPKSELMRSVIRFGSSPPEANFYQRITGIINNTMLGLRSSNPI